MALARNMVTVGGGTLASRVLAFARDAWIAALLGAGPFSEAFFAVLQVVNFFRRLLAEGALNSAFVPIWLKLRQAEDGEANAARFTLRALLLMGIVTGVVALAAVVAAPYVIAVIAPGFDATRRDLASLLLMIVAPYIVLAGLVAIGAAALSAQGRVLAVSIGTVTFNLVLLVALGLMMRESEHVRIVVWLAVAVVVAGAAQLLVAAVALVKGTRWPRVRTRTPDQTGALFKRALPGLIASGIPQLKLIAGAAVASASPAAVAWLYYANRLYELPLGVASIAISAVIVPHITGSLHAGEDDVARAQSRAFEIALGLALPAATGFAVLAWPIAGGLFEHGAFTADDTHAVASALMAICLGLPGHVLEKVLGAVSFAREDTRTPMLTALCGLAAAIAGSVLLFPQFGHVGVAGAIALSAWIGAALLGIVLSLRGWLRIEVASSRRIRLIVRATIMMALLLVLLLLAQHRLYPDLQNFTLGRIALLAFLVPFGVAVYAGGLHIFGVLTLKDLRDALRRNA